jgi:hypothetical protein
VLSIQYVYERVIAFLIHLSLKAGAKVQFFFNQTSFFGKIFFIPQNKPKTLSINFTIPPSLAFRVGKDTNAKLYFPNILYTFFKVF